MNKRLQNKFKLHRLWEEPTVGSFSTFADGEGDHGAGGGDDGGGDAGGTGSGGGGAGSGGDAGGKPGDSGNSGGGKPTDEEAKLLKDLMKHKTAREDAEKRLNELNAQLKEFEGIDPKAVKALLAQKADEERKQLEAKGEYERIVKQMADAHQAELEKAKGEKGAVERANLQLQQRIADLTVGAAFSGSQFVKDELTLTPTKARVIYGAHFEFKDDKVIAYDKPAGASDRTPLVDARGEPLSFDEALKKLIEADPDKNYLLRSKAKPGAGSGTAKGKGAAADPKPLTPAQKIAKGLKALADSK